MQISIRAIYEDAADGKLAKLAKRAAKYGQSIVWQKSPRVEVLKRKQWDGKFEDVELAFIDYDIEGSAPKIGDFKFLAMLEMLPAGVMVSGKELDGFGRDWAGECQHCNKKRSRSAGFVVEGPDGKKIVGKSCLRDHMGMDAPDGALWMFQWERDLKGAAEDEESGWGGAGRWEESVIGIVAASRAVIALYGWSSKGAAGDGGVSSASRVNWALGGWIGPKDDAARKCRDEVRAEMAARGDHYRAVAQDVVDWVAAMDPKNDYQRNLKAAMAGEVVPMKYMGLAVSAAAAFDAQVDRDKLAAERKAAEKEADKASDWVGQVGQRIEAGLVLVKRISLPDYGFGPSSIYVMRDEAGNRISWKSGVSLRVAGKPIEVGVAFRAKFSIKAHGEYQGVRESKVARLAVV